MAVCRIVCRQGLSLDLTDLLPAGPSSVAYFNERPVVKPMTEMEAGGFKHGGGGDRAFIGAPPKRDRSRGRQPPSRDEAD
jgi:hypothetical protein